MNLDAKILVIDDSDSIRKLVQKILQLQGYTVHTAASAAEGIDCVRAEHPDLVLCDVQMPEHDGYYVLEQLRQDQNFELIPFIFMSGQAVQRQDVRRGMTRGADDYLFKPFTPDELVEAVQTRLARHTVLRKKMEPAHSTPQLTDILLSYRQLETDLGMRIAQSASCALFTLDVDRFKRLNDALGFQSADQLLHQLLKRFDVLSAERTRLYHGPHAAQIIILSDALEKSELGAMARQMLALVSDPLNFQAYQLHLTCSIGVYQLESSVTHTDEALKKAYIAMNRAKQKGGNLFMFYQQDMHTSVTRKLTWENELHQALSHKWFVLHYQPQLDLITGEVQGMEALVRIQHPELGLIFPGEFIQIAEETGLIAPIGDWCLREACQQLKFWHNQGYRGLRVAVNVSVLQFQKQRFANRLEEILKEADLDGSFLELELTESALVRDLSAIKADLQKIRELGVKLAIDDFGTGYSSLSYLRHLPFDLLKIDQSFVRGMADNSASLAIPKAIIDMGHSLGLEILAEGIETHEQMLLLKSYGCDLGQGYYLSKPKPVPELVEILAEKCPVEQV